MKTDRITRFRGAGYEGYGLLERNKIRELDAPWSGKQGREHALESVTLLPPCAPSKIVCVGRNYVDHAKEMGKEVPAEPLIFLKPPSALIGPGDSIVYPPISENVHFEGELGVVIGKRGKHIPADKVDDYIFGYTCVNDVTARDLQRKDGQWTRGKGFDTFCPVGPWIVPKEAVVFADLRVRTKLDDEVRQDGSVQDMIFPVNVIIAFVTQFLTLEPGDLIATGTPSGVGPMQAGSTVSIEINGIGVLQNSVVAEKEVNR